MKISFTNAALSIVIEGNDSEFDAVEVLTALKAFRLTTVNHAPAEAENDDENYDVVKLQEVYGNRFVYNNESANPSKGFRQPQPGDVFLDPDTMCPRLKTTTTEYGPRLILTYR